MPIKFRCQHCRQFLGISRSKAGEIFDCPTCGWTLRVPDLDGTIRPLPDPGLNMQDSKLAKALDELASMDGPAVDAAVCEPANSAGGTGIEGRVIDDRDGNAGGDSHVIPRRAISSENGDGNSSLPAAGIQTMPEPVELPALPAPEPIDVEPKFRANRPVSLPADNGEDEDASSDDDSSASARPWRSTAPAGKSWRRLLAAAEFGLTEGDSTDEPVKESEPATAASASSRESADAAAERALPPVAASVGSLMRLSGTARFALFGVAALIFAGGFWLGRVTVVSVESESLQTTTDSSNAATERSSSALDSDDEQRRSAFRGRITFRSDSGERKPDQGASVIVLPVERQGTARLPASGWRSSDADEDQRMARSAIRAIGGDAVITDESGEFEIRLPGAGQFYLLALSNSLSRDRQARNDDIEEDLETYFERPSQLLGRVMYQFEQVHYAGDDVTPWDFSFGQL